VFEGGPPELAGRSLEGVGNGTRRWMVANRTVERRYGDQNPAYEPAHPHPLDGLLGSQDCLDEPTAFEPVT
jgi:hypothetical protein